MDAEPAFPPSPAEEPPITIYQTLGGRETCRKLAVAFYAQVEREPLLRSLYGPTLNCPIENLAAFFTQFFGGPGEYVQRSWSFSLREAHQRFAIGQQERDTWLQAMFQALEALNLEEPTRSALRGFFTRASTFLINQPSAALNASPPISQEASADENAGAISPMHREIAQRWQAQQILEELIAALRREQAEVVLACLANPVLQTTLRRDRATLRSVLALLSGSTQEPLLSYVHQRLVNDPELARECHPGGRTLLHEVAGRGSVSIVKLLLHLGADPNAADQWGHTPLYYVGNASEATNHADVVHVLAQAGANVNAQERLKHCTPLHMAARRGNVAVAEALLGRGADGEARDKLGETPLHRAVKCGKTEMAAFLLSRGANALAKGKGGLTPGQLARGPRMKQLFQTART